MVDNPYKSTSEKQIPTFVLALSGPLTQQKIFLANKLMVDWQVRVKLVSKKRKTDKECPYLQPATQNTYRRYFFGFMGSRYGWQISDHNFKGFEGCMSDILQALFANRYTDWVCNCVNVLFYLSWFVFASNLISLILLSSNSLRTDTPR